MNTISSSGPRAGSSATATNADNLVSRMRGLIGRTRLPRGPGLLIRPTWSVHTAFMRFAIDVVFLDRDLNVLALRRELRPWRAASHWRAHSVLELAAGECEALGLQVGDRLAWGLLGREP